MARLAATGRKRWLWGLVVLLMGAAGLLAFSRRSAVGQSRKGDGGGEKAPGIARQPELPPASAAPAGAPGAEARERFKRWRKDPSALERARKSADAKRARLRASREQAARAAAPPRREEHEKAVMPPLEGEGNQAGKALGEYIQQVVREQFFPMGRDCYEELLGRSPRASGRMELNVVVAGEREIGGVVDSVELGPGSTLEDEAFATCVRESMYAVEFDAPPDGHEQIDFSYPIMFMPAGGGPDAGSR